MEEIVSKKVEQINDHLFIGTYKSNNIKIGVNDMTVNDSLAPTVLRKGAFSYSRLQLGL